MDEIKKMYKLIHDKRTFENYLSEKLFLSEITVQNNFKKNGKFKTQHLPIVKHWLKIEIELQNKYKNMRVVDWELLDYA